MPNGHKVDIKRLEKKVTDLSNALAKLSSADDFKKLILILRRPGWTTPAEFAFALAIVDSMNAQAGQLGALKGQLLKGAGQVGVG